MAVEFDAPQERVSQGDLLLDAPSAYVKSLSWLVKTGKNEFTLRTKKPDALDPAAMGQLNVREELDKDREDGFGNAFGARRAGLVISHDCELDKPGSKRSALVALVRPLADVHQDDRPGIRDYQHKRGFYLPPTEHLEGEYFADLRVVTTLRIEGVVDELARPASLNEDGRLLLRRQIFRFFVRKSLPDDWSAWSDEAEEDR